MNQFKVFVGVLGVGAVVWWLGHDMSVSAQTDQSAAKPVRWEYMAELCDANALQAKLTEWSQANWELVSVANGVSVLEPGEKSSLRVDKYMLTAKRPVK